MTIVIQNAEMFEEAFGQMGLKVGPRTGPNQRTKDEKEWYVIRQFLKEAIAAQVFSLPLSVRKGEPPETDFIVRQRDQIILVEITEATDESDQREMTEMERSDEVAVLLGRFGGRFKDGASEPGHAWSSDIVSAIERKIAKAVFQRASGGHLIIYPNSNSSFLLFDYEDECRAFDLFRALIAARKDLTLAVQSNSVHILGSKAIFIDVLRKPKCVKRQW